MSIEPLLEIAVRSEQVLEFRVAWLLQDAGAYWQPIMSEFTRLCPQTKVFTAVWSGFLPGFENAFDVQQIGAMKVLSAGSAEQSKGYAPTVTYLSPSVIKPLLQYKPEVIFTTAFSIWTMLVVLLKWLGNWRVVIVYDGSSPGVDYQGNTLRQVVRRLLTRWTDGFITNNQAGQQYLVDGLGAKPDRVVVRPYLVPHPKTYERSGAGLALKNLPTTRPIFIFAGHHIPRKGLRELLRACTLLHQRGCDGYSLLILGDGPERQELEAFAEAQGLGPQTHWIGNVPYEQVGHYFQQADVFVFPTLEDVWGLVAVEAMLFGKPVLCSKWAGTSELMVDGKNGYIIDPHQPEHLAECMMQLIENPALIAEMGEQSRAIMKAHTPEQVAQSLVEVVELVLAK